MSPDMKVKAMRICQKEDGLKAAETEIQTERSKQGDKEEWKLKNDEKTPNRGHEMTDIETYRMTEGKRAWAHHLRLSRADWWLTEGRWQAFHVGYLCHPWRHHCLHFFTLSLHPGIDTHMTGNLLEVSKIWDCAHTHTHTHTNKQRSSLHRNTHNPRHTYTQTFRDLTQRVCVFRR